MTYSLIPKDMSNRIHEPLNAPFVSSLTPEQVCSLSTHQNHPNMSNCPGCVVGNHQNERLPGLGNEATVLGRVLCEACHVGESLFLFTSELCHRGTFKTQCCCHLFFEEHQLSVVSKCQTHMVQSKSRLKYEEKII